MWSPLEFTEGPTPVVLVLYAPGPDVPPFPGSQVFPAFAVPSVQDTLPSSSEGNINEFLSIKCWVTCPFLRRLP